MTEQFTRRAMLVLMADAFLLAACGGANPHAPSTVIAAPDLSSLHAASNAPAYYVDAVNGNDSANGRSPATAWKTLGKIHTVVLKPGDVVRLARGSVWTKQQILLDNGSAGSAIAPVIFEAYGTGAAPTISQPCALWDPYPPFQAIHITGSASYINILDLRIQDAGEIHGIVMTENTHHIVVAGTEILGCGEGITVDGSNQRLLSNDIHDIGAAGLGGGIGIGLMGTIHEVAWNRFTNCRVINKDGTDGGALEYYGRRFHNDGSETFDVSDNIRIHHNVIDNCYDFMECWGNVTNMLIAYNLYVNSDTEALEFHFDDSEHPTWTHECTYDVRIENNTFVPTVVANPGGWGVVGQLYDPKHLPDPAKSKIVLRNNIFVTNYKVTSENVLGNKFIHDHNIIQLLAGGAIGQAWTLDSTDRLADPIFMDAAGKDYRLAANSPAIGSGGTSGFAGNSVDLLGVVVSSVPDVGAYQRV